MFLVIVRASVHILFHDRKSIWNVFSSGCASHCKGQKKAAKSTKLVATPLLFVCISLRFQSLCERSIQYFSGLRKSFFHFFHFRKHAQIVYNILICSYSHSHMEFHVMISSQNFHNFFVDIK